MVCHSKGVDGETHWRPVAFRVQLTSEERFGGMMNYSRVSYLGKITVINRRIVWGENWVHRENKLRVEDFGADKENMPIEYFYNNHQLSPLKRKYFLIYKTKKNKGKRTS